MPAISAIFECANCSPRVCPRFRPTCSLCQPTGPSTIVAAPRFATFSLLANSSHHIFGSWQITYTPSLKIVCIAWERVWVLLFYCTASRRSSFSYLGGFCVDDVLVTKEQQVLTFCAHYLYTQGCKKECTIIANLEQDPFTKLHGIAKVVFSDQSAIYRLSINLRCRWKL